MDNYRVTSQEIKERTAIVLLAYSDYESLELSLATHARYSVNSGIPLYILQNGRGTYDTERTYAVGKKYENLFPRCIKVIDHIPPQKPYLAIRQLFEDKVFSDYEYIIKLDDDVMVLTPDWIDKLVDCYCKAYRENGESLAYVTSLVNNNPFGFKMLIDHCDELAQEYFGKIAREHIVGAYRDDNANPYRLVSKDQVYGGGFGTVWKLPYVARWVHQKTTLDPEYYISITKDLGYEEVNAKERYSINCMLFNKKMWSEISDGRTDDEQLWHEYCLFKGKKIYADLSIPMIHIAFYSQREEIRDMIPAIRNFYREYLSLPFPISLCDNKLVDIENRIRYMETRTTATNNNIYYDFEEMKNSVSFRIGRMITWLPRKARDVIRRLK